MAGASEAIRPVAVGRGSQQTRLAGVGWADVGGGRVDTVFGEAAFFDANAALGAGQTTTADALDRHAQLASGVEECLVGSRLAAAAGGHEDDVMFAVGRSHVNFTGQRRAAGGRTDSIQKFKGF